MTETITEQEYEEKVETYAGHLVDAVKEDPPEHWQDDPHGAVLGAAVDVLDGHEWFFKSRHGAAVHGAIIEFSEANPADYGDWETNMEADSPEEAIKRLAYDCFEADVVEAARERLSDEVASE